MPNGKYIPVAYGLLPDKTAHTYTKFMGILAKATPGMFAGKLLVLFCSSKNPWHVFFLSVSKSLIISFNIANFETGFFFDRELRNAKKSSR